MGANSSLHSKGYIVHWSHELQVLRTIPWEDMETIKTLILDPSVDKFTILSLTRIPDADNEDLVDPLIGSPPALENLPNYHPNTETRVEIFELDNETGAFKSTSRQTQRMLLRNGEKVDSCCIQPGQLSMVDKIKHWDSEHDVGKRNSNSAEHEVNERYIPEPSHCFDHRFCSLEKEQGFVINRAVTVQRPRYHDGFEFISPSPGVFYFSRFQNEGYGADDVSIMRPYSPDFSPDHQQLYESIDQLPEGKGARAFGDSDFLVFVKEFAVCIRSFNDSAVWDPSEIH